MQLSKRSMEQMDKAFGGKGGISGSFMDLLWLVNNAVGNLCTYWALLGQDIFFWVGNSHIFR